MNNTNSNSNYQSMNNNSYNNLNLNHNEMKFNKIIDLRKEDKFFNSDNELS